MASKFGLNYHLKVTTPEAEIEIDPPFTLEFSIMRNDLSSANTAALRIYNLGEQNRNLIRQAPSDYGRMSHVQVQLNAGYGDDLPMIFRGYATEAWSVREGVNFITDLECLDGGGAFITPNINMTFQAGTPISSVISAMIDSMVSQTIGIAKGVIGNFEGTLDRAQSYSGDAFKVLNEITGGCVFIDNGIVNCLKNNEFFEQSVLEISNETGLLNTPKLEWPRVICDVLFEPHFTVGQKVSLMSLTAKQFNTTVQGRPENKPYKIISIAHKGIIAPTISGPTVTTVGLLDAEFFDFEVTA